MQAKTDEIYMQRCLELASAGLGYTAPNPMVGCVIVHNGRIKGEGYHQEYGAPHAEVNAINAVQDLSLLEKSTLYVSLEPCAHHGKTPPCADLIARRKIPEVVSGCRDTNPGVEGNGIARLKAYGVNVRENILEKECRAVNKRFFTFHEQNRPYIILKWAQTKDGFTDAERSPDQRIAPLWITNDYARMLVHKWRAEEQAIMIGRNTAEKDNPRLNIREWHGKNPVRLVFDKDLILPASLHVFDNTQQTLVFTAREKADRPQTRYISIDFRQDVIPQVIDELVKHRIQSLIVEGGTILLNSFISLNLWDEARVFTGNKKFLKGVKAPDFPFLPIKTVWVGESLLEVFRNE